MSADRSPGAVYTRPFVALCVTYFLFYVSFQLLLPVVPVYAAAALRMSDAQLGLIIGVFAFSAMLWRPLAGWLADGLGRRPLVLLGPLVFCAASLGYPLVTGVGAFLALRFAHGVGMGFGPTAGSVVVADLASADRRGEAMGVYGLTTTTGLAFAPYLGIEIAARLGFVAAFLAAAAVALIAFAVALTIPETRPREAWRHTPALRWRDFFAAGAVYPSAILAALFFGYGGIVSFVAVFATRRGLGNPGLYFTVLALAVLVARAQAGRLADRLGRRLVIAPALAMAGLGLLGLAAAETQPALLAAGLLYGVGFGAGQPALMAMTTDRVAPAERGRAMGTFFAAWELGISSGSVVLGLCAERWGYPVMWSIAAGVAGAGALAALPDLRRRRG